MNIYKEASRLKLRFPTYSQTLSVDDLWDIPIESKGFEIDLNGVLNLVKKQIKHPRFELEDVLLLKKEIVDDVIKTRSEEVL